MSNIHITAQIPLSLAHRMKFEFDSNFSNNADVVNQGIMIYSFFKGAAKEGIIPFTEDENGALHALSIS